SYPSHVGERGHVHDGHARHIRLRDRVKQPANTRGAVLRLLHGETNQIVFTRIDLIRSCRRHPTRQSTRIYFHRFGSPTDRQADAKSLGIDEIRFLGKADQLHGMPPEKDLRRKQRTVRCAKDKNVEFRHRAFPFFLVGVDEAPNRATDEMGPNCAENARLAVTLLASLSHLFDDKPPLTKIEPVNPRDSCTKDDVSRYATLR